MSNIIRFPSDFFAEGQETEIMVQVEIDEYGSLHISASEGYDPGYVADVLYEAFLMADHVANTTES